MKAFMYHCDGSHLSVESYSFKLKQQPFKLLFAIELVVCVGNIPILFINVNVDRPVHSIQPLSDFCVAVSGYPSERPSCTWLAGLLIECLPILCWNAFQRSLNQLLKIPQERHGIGGGSRPEPAKSVSSCSHELNGLPVCLHACDLVFYRLHLVLNVAMSTKASS